MGLHLERRYNFGALIFVIISVQLMPLMAQNGFLSIDCGGNISQYTDDGPRLNWTNDENYIQSGLIEMVPYIVNQTRDNHLALQSFRYFPERETKYCYNLSVGARNISVLIRAHFLHGGSPVLRLPIHFDIYVNATLWDSIEYSSYESRDVKRTPKVLEGIFFFGGNAANVCLVPRQGIPFISSLELRNLDSDGIMYSFGNIQGREDLFLSRIYRWNLGIDPYLCPTSLRYPDDAYDRLWTCRPRYPRGEFTGSGFTRRVPGTNNVSLGEAGEATQNYVPKNVMATGLSPIDYIGFGYTLELPLPSSSRIYAIFYFLDLNPSQSGGRVMNISFQGQKVSNVNINNSSVSMEVYEHSLVSLNTVSMTFSSNVTPILNAMELYEEKIVDHYSTDPDNVRLIDQLLTTFNLPGHGDPCIPVPYGWITCSPSKNLSTWVFNYPSNYAARYSGKFYPTYVESIYLSHLSDTRRLLSFTNENKYRLIFLERMSIIHSDLDDEILQFVLENITSRNQAAYISRLDVTNNSIASFPSSLITNNTLLSVLNLSRNNFQGEAFSFNDVSNPIETLNMSFNSLSAFPTSWENAEITDYPSLKIMDFSNNKLSNLSSLRRFVQRTTSQLETVYLSNNNFTEDFPADLYFPGASKLRILNLDQNNIRGVLDLTNWEAENLTNQMALSLVNNSIKDIYPDVASLQPIIDRLRNLNGSGILLGGNPYCNGASSLAQRYLCRSSFDEEVQEREKKGSKLALILGATFGGVFAIMLSSVFLIIIVRLRKQVRSLREFQLELATKRVQPPLYSYEDLKLATKDFHEDNKLGSGTFGAVYKGELRDRSLVAVKVLFYNERQATPQLMDQFLNEVVLITNIKHKNLVQLHGCCVRGKKKILVYEFAENGDVADALWGKRAETTMLSWKNRLNICVGVARGLSYLHEELQPRIIHRDIKAANILLDKNLNPKIADFGLAKPFEEEDTHAQFTHVAGTRGYWAPEYVLEGQLTQKADVYSFGVLVLEILSGRPGVVTTLPKEEVVLKKRAETLQAGERPLELLQRQLRNECPEDEVKRVINTALLCVESDPQVRPTMSAAVFMLVGGTETRVFESCFGGEDQDAKRFHRGHIRRGKQGFAPHEESEKIPLVCSSQVSVNSLTRDEDGQSSDMPSFELREIETHGR